MVLQASTICIFSRERVAERIVHVCTYMYDFREREFRIAKVSEAGEYIHRGGRAETGLRPVGADKNE